MKKETTLAKVADTDILLPECTCFFPYRPAESPKPPSSTNNKTLPSYLRVSAAFRFHKKRAAASEPKSSVRDTSSSTAHQSLPSALDTQAQKEYAPCASDMQLVKYTPGPRIIVLWAVLHIPVMILRALHVHTPCPPDKQLVKYTPKSSLEILCVVRHRLTTSPVRTDAVDDGTIDNEAMDIEGSSTIYVEPTNGGGESQVQHCAQYMSQDRFGTLAASTETSDMDMEQSEPESVDNDVEMEDDDGTDPTTKASHYKPGKWAKELRKSSDESSDAESDSDSDSNSQSDDSDNSDQDMDMGGTGNVDGKITSSLGPDTKVADGEEDTSSEGDSEGDDSDSDTISNPPSIFEEENPLEKMGEEDGEDESESGSEEEVSGDEMDEGGSVHGNSDMDEDPDGKSSSDSSDSDSSDNDDAAEPAKGTTAGDEEGSSDDMDEDDLMDNNGEEEIEGDSESESGSERERARPNSRVTIQMRIVVPKNMGVWTRTMTIKQALVHQTPIRATTTTKMAFPTNSGACPSLVSPLPPAHPQRPIQTPLRYPTNPAIQRLRRIAMMHSLPVQLYSLPYPPRLQVAATPTISPIN